MSLEDRFEGGELIPLRPRPIEIGPQGRLIEFMVPAVLPMLAALGALLLVLSTGPRLIPLPHTVWTAIGLACLVGGGLVGSRVSGRLRANYRRGLQRGLQPSAAVDATGIELTLPEVGLQCFEWSDITALAFKARTRSRSTWHDKERCELLGQNGQTLAVVPWSLVLPEGEYQLGDYMVAAAPRRFAPAPITCLLAGYPSQSWSPARTGNPGLAGHPSQLACVTLALQALENSPAAEG